MALVIFSLSLLGTYYPYNGGAMLTSVVVLYALTAGIAGYVSAALYKIMGGAWLAGWGAGGRAGWREGGWCCWGRVCRAERVGVGLLAHDCLVRRGSARGSGAACACSSARFHSPLPAQHPADSARALPPWHRLAGTNWVRNVLTTTMLFCGPLLAMFSYLNTVSEAAGGRLGWGLFGAQLLPEGSGLYQDSQLV